MERAGHREFEQHILEDPDDEQRYRAYGAWLRDQGDPRGKFCEVQAWLFDTQREHEARVAESENAGWAVDLARTLELPIGWLLDATWPGPLDKRLRQWEEDVYARGIRTREFALWREHGAAWTRGLERQLRTAQLQLFRTSHHLGFLRHARIQDTRAERAVATFRSLAAHPVARFLRELEIAVPSHQSIVDALVREPPPPLRSLVLQHRCDSRRPCTLAPLYERLPALRKLGVALHRGPTELGSIVLPELRSFGLSGSTPLTTAHLRAVTTAHWPKLKRLSIDFSASHAPLAQRVPLNPITLAWELGQLLQFYLSPDSRQHRPAFRFALDESAWRLRQLFARAFTRARPVAHEVDRPCTVDDLAPILEAQGLGELVWLDLAAAPSPDRLPALLAHASMLKQLAVLELGVIGEAGARALLDHASAFQHLKRLALHVGSIPAELTKELASLCADVRIRHDG